MSIIEENHKAMRRWSKLKGENSWTMFKVIAELVDGFDRLNTIGPCVSLFGSARTKPDEFYYNMAIEIAHLLTDEGFGVITGGGPGIMEAANKGARMYGGVSVGLNIDLPNEQGHNLYIDPDKNLKYRYFFVRKVMLVKYAQAFIVLPGGMGTLDEMFEVLTLIQTKKISRVPVILVGTKYWTGLKEWMKYAMLELSENINAVDLELFSITDDPNEVVKIITEFYASEREGELSPNYDLD